VCATTVGGVAVLPSVERNWPAGTALDAYLAADPSLRIARDLTARRDRSSAGFYAFLRANAAVETAVRPIDISFVTSFGRPRRPPPHIFLFVVDSLRRDYVSPYNSAVTFTPALAAFARESVVFTRAFSRYGGTALSVPAIWAGGMIAHKEYVTPFAPMNALAKLLDAHDYRRFITSDHITDELFPRAPGAVDLDRGVPEMQHAFCRTVSELEAKLASEPPARPIFAHTRPLDLHIGNVWSAMAPPGESYPGFFAPYAARVRQIDACFGRFIAFLRKDGLYDESIVIVTSDHGDSLGEGLRWGHGFTVFPEVLSVPLIVHMPARLATEYKADTDRVSFTVDITPTLYRLAGDEPAAREPQYGAPLFARSAGELTDRRQETFLVASSYGAVYGVLSANGARLYVADATNGREYAFALTGRPDGERVGLTDSQRETARRAMREQLEAIAADYDGHQP
jgi:arylsulfatase A-like enzyme